MENKERLLYELNELKNTPSSVMNEISANDFFANAEKTQDLGNNEPRDIDNEPELKSALENEQNRSNIHSSIPDPLNQRGNVNIGAFMGGKTGVMIIDSVVPLIFWAILKYGIGVKVSRKELQLTAKEREEIEPLVKNCMDSLNMNFDNPFIALGITMAMVYGSKSLEVGMNKYDEKQASKKESPQADDSAPLGYNKNGTIKKDARGRKRA